MTRPIEGGPPLSPGPGPESGSTQRQTVTDAAFRLGSLSASSIDPTATGHLEPPAIAVAGIFAHLLKRTLQIMT